MGLKDQQVVPPGDVLRNELEIRDWTQQDLADIMGCSLRLVNEVITGRRAITPETAMLLAGALGTSAQYWMDLETAYQLTRVKGGGVSVQRRAKLYAVAPVNELIRRNWIERSNNYDELEDRVLKFMKLNGVDDTPRPLAHAARMSATYGKETPSQRAWLRRVAQLAPAVTASGFSTICLGRAVNQLHKLMKDPEEIRHVPRTLAEVGIRFLIVEHLAGTKIDGASFWLDARSPVIVLSLRYGRIDCFWHTLFHELVHLNEAEGRERPSYVDLDLLGDSETSGEKPETEKIVDEQASDLAIPKERFESFIRRTHPLYSKRQILAFAHIAGVHPGIVVGQLQYRKKITYAQNREMLVAIRNHITQSALTDGWGHKPRIKSK